MLRQNYIFIKHERQQTWIVSQSVAKEIETTILQKI